MGVFFAESPAELTDILTRLILAVDHDAVRTRLYIGISTFEGVTHGFAGNKAFDTRNDHKVTGDLGILPCSDLIAETLDTILSLDSVSTKKGILLQTDFIFNDYRRNAVTFQSSHSKDKVLDLATRVSIKNNRLGGAFKDIVQVL